MNSYYRAFIKKQTNYFTIIVNTANTGISNNNQFNFTGGLGNFRVIATQLDNVIDQNPIAPRIGFGKLSDAATITLPNIGIYELKVIPVGPTATRFRRIQFNNGGDRLKLLRIKNWGNVTWSGMSFAFFGCSNMELTAQDIPTLATTVTSLESTFNGCSTMTGINTNWNWSINNIIILTSCFNSCTLFNGNVGNWNTSNVTFFNALFNMCVNFNQNLGSWNVANGTTFTTMLNGCTAYTNLNQPLNWTFRTTGTVTFSTVFTDCVNFNLNLNSWNTERFTTIFRVFRGCTNFNNGQVPSDGSGSLTWNTSNVTNMGEVFRDCTSFNQQINTWNVSNVVNFSGTFRGALNFNQPLNNWNINTNPVAQVNMSFMFGLVSPLLGSFNQDISMWNVSRVTNMADMFNNQANFNCGVNSAGINNWNISQVTSMTNMFNRTSFNRPISNWNTSLVTNMSVMFRLTPFNQDISNWNVSNVTDMNNMFSDNLVFNNGLAPGISGNGMNSWNTSQVTDMSQMFRNCESFNQNISNWNVSQVTTMQLMFQRCISFNQNLGSWNVANVTNFSTFLGSVTSATFDSVNLDAIYIGWSALNPPVQPNLNISFGTATPTAAGIPGRNFLVNDRNWVILDGL